VSEISENPDLLRQVADDLLDNAERCYRLARGTLDLQVRDKLVQLARQFELRAEEARTHARRIGRA